jgi:2-dehydro-3-deoxyphosphogluconate aldolase/(4S)-4-hydroxy-2-oxoglutarate aldolase
MNKAEVRAHIEEIGIIPAVRVASAEDARFAVETLFQAGIPIAEITMTVPGAIELISQFARDFPEMVIGAGTVLDLETAQRCIDAGAMFLTSTGLDLTVVNVAVKHAVLVFPGALTPTEVIAAWKAGSDLVKVFPCAQLGGEHYIRALKVALPQIPLIATGGVRQHTAVHFIQAGATAIGVGRDLIPQEAVRKRNRTWILELAHRFVALVKNARSHTQGGGGVVTFK